MIDLPAYSPKRIRFYLRHIPALESLAENPAASAGEGERLGREWTLLLDRRGLDCLCREIHDWPEIPASPGGGRHFESGEHPWSDTLADLERGVEDALLHADPLSWSVTRSICAEMGLTMLSCWQWRYSVAHGFGGETVRRPILDTRPTFDMAVRLMAAELGWVSHLERSVLLTTA